MAEFYLDVSAVGNQYQAYADTPATWGVPQDGNGLAATGGAVAVATIDCAGASATGTGTVGVLGVTVSSTLNASGAALATAIVTAINASATATTATYSAALLSLNRLVFARVNPGVSTEVQIMLRIAGADWNGMTPTRANITGGGVTAFAGGANGPSAYLCSTSTNLFGKGARGYGLLTALRVPSVVDPLESTDVIHVRTRRDGVDLEVVNEYATTAAFTWYLTPSASNRQFLFDDGTVWPGDAGLMTFRFTVLSASAGTSLTWALYASRTLLMSSRTGRRFRIYLDARSGIVNINLIQLGGSSRIFNDIEIEESPASSAGFFCAAPTEASVRSSMTGGRWSARSARRVASAGDAAVQRVHYANVEFVYSGLTNNVSSIVNLNGAGVDQQFRFTACSFADQNGVYSVTSPVTGGTYNNTNHIVEFDGCSGVDAVASGWLGTAADGGRQLLWENFGPSRDWRVESGSWLAEWRAGQNFPTLNSLLPGGQPWSAKVLLRNANVWSAPQKVLKLPGYYRDTTATKMVTLEFLAQQAFSRSQLGLLLAYIDNNDVVRYQSTMLSQGRHLAAPVNCDTSAAPWTLNGQTGYTAYKLALTTAFPIKQGTEFVAWVLFTGPLAADQTIYFDAEVGLT